MVGGFVGCCGYGHCFRTIIGYSLVLAGCPVFIGFANAGFGSKNGLFMVVFG